MPVFLYIHSDTSKYFVVWIFYLDYNVFIKKNWFVCLLFVYSVLPSYLQFILVHVTLLTSCFEFWTLCLVKTSEHGVTYVCTCFWTGRLGNNWDLVNLLLTCLTQPLVNVCLSYYLFCATLDAFLFKVIEDIPSKILLIADAILRVTIFICF